MHRLRPGRYEAETRSSSSSSPTSSAGTSSSRGGNGAHTPSTSPSLSEPGGYASDYNINNGGGWSDYGYNASASGGANGSDAGQKLSPLEMLMQRGKQVQHEIWHPEADAVHSGKSRIYERVTALSRKTSVKQPRYQPSPDSDDFDDAQSVRSINLVGDGSEAGTFSVISGRRTSNGSKREVLASHDSQWKSARDLGYDDDPSSWPQRFASSSSSASSSSAAEGGSCSDAQQRAWGQRESGHLLGNAFRDSIASDISFNSITGQNDRASLYDQGADGVGGSDIYSSDLYRRDSVDTVRSSEFGEDGRWGRAWANKADDEESVFGESTYGGEADGGWGSERYSVMDRELEIEPGPESSPFDFHSGSKLDGITEQWKASQRQASGGSGRGDAQTHIQQQQQQQPHHLSSFSPLPQIQSVPAKEHVVNLTRSAAGPAMTRNGGGLFVPDGAAAASGGQSQRQSFVGSIHEAKSGSDDSSRDTIYARDVDQTPLAGGSQRQLGLGHRANDSTSTLGSGSGGAKVYVYPPSPSGSEASREGGSSSQGVAGRRFLQAAIPQSSRAIVETMDASPQQARAAYAKGHMLHHAEAKPKVPVAPSNLLAQPHGPPIIGQQAGGRPRTSGHPAGRPPPPTPTTQTNFSPAGYADPNRPSGGAAARPVLGQARSAAIAAANGRESIISDLDVETLRLDASSRRDSTSTINSVMTSRMSIGSVRYDDIGLPSTAEEAGGAGNDDAGVAGGAPSKAAWDPTARLRPADLPSPRRAFTSPSETGNECQPSPSRSNTHPMQDSVWPSAGKQWGANGADGADSNDTAMGRTLRDQPSKASLGSGPPSSSSAPLAVPPPLRQAKSSAAISTLSTNSINSSSGSGSGSTNVPLASSVAMRPSLSAFSGSSALSTQTSRSTKSQGADTRTGPSTAEDFLSQGITYHEQGDLSRSAFYFERSARVDGGCVVGMCMFGMALREGWGARKDPKKGFEWIQRAAAKAGEMMQNGSGADEVKSQSEMKAIRSELKLSVYELGKCFCYGWGVKMDKSMALEYFELAAKLGDSDAQAEAGALYASGKGCKKDLKKAAMYYRMAEEGGYDTVGLSWIHKDKYK